MVLAVVGPWSELSVVAVSPDVRWMDADRPCKVARRRPRPCRFCPLSPGVVHGSFCPLSRDMVVRIGPPINLRMTSPVQVRVENARRKVRSASLDASSGEPACEATRGRPTGWLAGPACVTKRSQYSWIRAAT